MGQQHGFSFATNTLIFVLAPASRLKILHIPASNDYQSTVQNSKQWSKWNKKHTK